MSAAALTDRIAQGLIGCTLDKSQWTHEAHLRAGLWHALHHDPVNALALLRDRISAFNASVGGTNSDTEGYHETITAFYVQLIAGFLSGCNRGRPIDDLADALIAQWGARDLPLKYYSRDLLFSTRARRHWVEPDLAPLPYRPPAMPGP